MAVVKLNIPDVPKAPKAMDEAFALNAPTKYEVLLLLLHLKSPVSVVIAEYASS